MKTSERVPKRKQWTKVINSHTSPLLNRLQALLSFVITIKSVYIYIYSVYSKKYSHCNVTTHSHDRRKRFQLLTKDKSRGVDSHLEVPNTTEAGSSLLPIELFRRIVTISENHPFIYLRKTLW